MNTKADECPFKVGDKVIYKPSPRGYGLEATHDGRLEPGRTYVVSEIQNDRYVVVHGYSHPGGGLYWTEFEAAE